MPGMLDNVPWQTNRQIWSSDISTLEARLTQVAKDFTVSTSHFSHVFCCPSPIVHHHHVDAPSFTMHNEKNDKYAAHFSWEKMFQKDIKRRLKRSETLYVRKAQVDQKTSKRDNSKEKLPFTQPQDYSLISSGDTSWWRRCAPCMVVLSAVLKRGASQKMSLGFCSC